MHVITYIIIMQQKIRLVISQIIISHYPLIQYLLSPNTTRNFGLPLLSPFTSFQIYNKLQLPIQPLSHNTKCAFSWHVSQEKFERYLQCMIQRFFQPFNAVNVMNSIGNNQMHMFATQTRLLQSNLLMNLNRKDKQNMKIEQCLLLWQRWWHDGGKSV